MNTKFSKLLAIVAVALMVISCCACLMGGGTEGSSVNALTNPTPIKIDNNGNLVDITESYLETEYGATYSYDGETATLVFNEDCDITFDDNKTESFIFSEVNTAIVVNCDINITVIGDGINYDSKPIFINSSNLSLSGNGSLEINISKATGVIGIQSKNSKISLHHISITTKDIGQSISNITAEDDIVIERSSISLKYDDTSTKYPAASYGINSTNATIKNCIIDIDIKSNYGTFGIEGVSKVDIENSKLDVRTLAKVNNENIVSCSLCTPSVNAKNCDIVLAPTAPAKSKGYSVHNNSGSTTMTVTSSNMVFSTSSKIMNNGTLTLGSGWEYKLLKEDGTETTETNFPELTKGTISNENITVGFDLNGGIGKAPSSETNKKCGDTITIGNQKPIKIGCNFIGWTDGFKIYHPGDEYTVSINIELKALYDGPSCGFDEGSAIIATIVTSVLLAMLAFFIILIGRRRRDDE